jgi:hypothetical protein
MMEQIWGHGREILCEQILFKVKLLRSSMGKIITIPTKSTYNQEHHDQQHP